MRKKASIVISNEGAGSFTRDALGLNGGLSGICKNRQDLGLI